MNKTIAKPQDYWLSMQKFSAFEKELKGCNHDRLTIIGSGSHLYAKCFIYKHVSLPPLTCLSLLGTWPSGSELYTG